MALPSPYYSVLYVEDRVSCRDKEELLEKQVCAHFDRPVVFTVVPTPFHALERMESTNIHAVIIRYGEGLFPARDFVQIMRRVDYFINVIYLVPDTMPEEERKILLTNQSTILVEKRVCHGLDHTESYGYAQADLILTLARYFQLSPRSNFYSAHVRNSQTSLESVSLVNSSSIRRIPLGGGQIRGIPIKKKELPLPHFIKAEPMTEATVSVMVGDMPPPLPRPSAAMALSVTISGQSLSRDDHNNHISPTSISEYSPHFQPQPLVNMVNNSGLKRKRAVVSENEEDEILDRFLTSIADTTQDNTFDHHMGGGESWKRYPDAMNDLEIDWECLKSSPMGFTTSSSPFSISSPVHCTRAVVRGGSNNHF